MKHFLLKSIRTKLILSFLMVALLPLVWLALINKQTTEKALTENAQQALSAAATETANRIDRFIDENLNSVRVEAILPGLAGYLSLPPEQRENSAQKQLARETLIRLSRKDMLNINSYALLDLEGRNVLDTNTGNIGQDESDQDYFQQPFNTELPFVSAMKVSPKNSTLVNLFFSSLVRDGKGNILGVLRISYNATVVQQLVTRQTERAGAESFALLLDDYYIHLAHSQDASLLFKSITPLAPNLVSQLQTENRLPTLPASKLAIYLPELKTALDTQKSFLITSLATPDRKRNLIAIAPLEYQRWFVVFARPIDIALAPVNRQIQNTFILVTVIAGIVIIIAFTISQLLTKPLLYLNQIVSQFSTGTLDIRVKVNSNDEISQLADSFNQMADQLQTSFNILESKNSELQKLDQLKDEFLANTSHELRTPLNGIIGIAESLLDGATGELPETTQANLGLIVSSGRRLSSLVNDILDFAKLRHQTLELHLKPVDLRTVTQLVLTLSQPLIFHKELELVNSIPENMVPAEADENRLQQILYNLIGNAIKFTPNGKIEISAEKMEETHQIAISISDTGIGIPEDKLDSIFDSFTQVEGSSSREYSGTGLGLSVTKKLVELQGGNIKVESQMGIGSRFTFTLPISNQTVELTSETNITQNRVIYNYSELPFKIEQPKINNNSENIKVLIVDDEPVNLQVLVNIFSIKKYTVYQAQNGEEVLSLIDQGLRPDIILLDVMMPKMTGYEVTQKLRERFLSTELPILLLTAKNQVQDIVTGLNLGANDYLTKPIAKDELLARIRTHIHLSQVISENIRMGAELDVTRKLQQMILPKPEELELIQGLEIAGMMEPADEVGGDYYDVLQYNGIVKIAIGDVTGHGLESGMLMLMVQTAIRTLLESEQSDFTKFLNIVNRTIYGNVQRMNSDKNLTLSILEYGNQTLKFTGQHEELIWIKSDGNVQILETIDLGFPIGLEPDIIDFIAEEKIKLNSGDIIILYTDGITEAANINHELYGLSRLIEVAKSHHQSSAQEIRNAIIEDIKKHIDTQKVFDDMTLVVLKQK